MKTKTQQLQMIEKAWLVLSVLNDISACPYADRLFDISLEEEKLYRKFAPKRTSAGITETEASKLYCVKQIALALRNMITLKIEDYLSVPPSLFYVHSLVANYRTEIEKALAGFDLQELAALDYAELMKP